MAAQVWAISTNKGGVLKTSLTVNLAGLLSQKKKVLIVDTDNQGNCLVSFGKNPDQANTTLYDVMVDDVPAQYAIQNVYKNIDILPSNDDMAFLEFDVLTNATKYPKPFHLLRQALEVVRKEYDIILVDTPPNMGLVQGNVLSFADKVLIPFQPEPYNMRSLVKIIKVIREFRENQNRNLSILGVIPTLVDMRTNVHDHTLQECRKYCYERDITIFNTVIPKTIRFATSIAYERLPATLTHHNRDVKYYGELLVEVFQECEKTAVH